MKKESRLILAVDMASIDLAHPDKTVSGGSVELRGNTDRTSLTGAGLMLDHTLGFTLSP